MSKFLTKFLELQRLNEKSQTNRQIYTAWKGEFSSLFCAQVNCGAFFFTELFNVEAEMALSL